MSRSLGFTAGFAAVLVAGVLLWFFTERVPVSKEAAAPKPSRKTGPPRGGPRIRGAGGEAVPIGPGGASGREASRPPADGATGGKDGKKELALKILDARLAMHDPRRMMERGAGDMEAMRSMGPDLAAFFISEFRASEGERRQTALFLAIESGGADAAAFLKEIMNEGIVPPEERLLVLRSLPGIPSAGGLPADEETVNAAFRMTGSAEADERKGAAGILAWQDTAQARVALMELSAKDTDSWVRAAAIRALGRNGDRSTLAHLAAYPREGLDVEYWVGGALEDAERQIRERLGGPGE